MAQDLRDNVERFRLVFERSLDGIVVFDGDGRYLLANPAACELLGYSLAELLTKRILDIPSVGSPTTAELFEAYQMTGRDIGCFHFRRPDGTECILEYTAIRITADEHIGILRNATDREKAMFDLQRLAAIVASSNDSIIGLSSDGLITDWNHGAERLFGYKSADVLGKPVTLLAIPERFEEAKDLVRRVLCGEEMRERETVVARKTAPVSMSRQAPRRLGIGAARL